MKGKGVMVCRVMGTTVDMGDAKRKGSSKENGKGVMKTEAKKKGRNENGRK